MVEQEYIQRSKKNRRLVAHELKHYNQQLRYGFSNFYGKYVFENFRSGYFGNIYGKSSG